jgi:hypothetical protein
MARLHTVEEIAAAGRAAVGDRQPTPDEVERICAILAPVAKQVIRRIPQTEAA